MHAADQPRGMPQHAGAGHPHLRWALPLLFAGLLLLALPSIASGQATTTLPDGVASAVRDAAAARANVSPAQVEIARSEWVVWNDGCLGAPQTGEACTQALVSGFAVWVTAGGTAYRYHTDYSGSNARFAESGVTISTDPIPSGAEAFEPNVDALPDNLATLIREDAASRTNTSAATVEILRVEAVTWNDACLGAAGTGEFCAEVLTPGFVVWVAAGGQLHRFHTDAQSNIRYAEGGLDRSNLPLLELPQGAAPRTTSPGGNIVEGEVPSEGVALLTVTQQADPARIRASLLDRGCTPALIAITTQGRWQTYRYTAPDFVNAGFPGTLAAGRQFATKCFTPQDGGGTGGFSTAGVDQTGRTGNGALVEVRVGEHQGFDRIVFEFASELAGPLEIAAGVPPYSVGYVQQASECGSGMPVDLQGDAMLRIHLPGTFIYNPETGAQLVNTTSIPTDHQVILAVEEICGFEGDSTWVVGTPSQAPFRVTELSAPTRLVVDIQVP